jgi:ATP-binding cassette subfamily F protein 3
MSLVTADQVSVFFGKKTILDDASFTIQPGERIGLVGPNGSGKTTLLRLLVGERETDDGDIYFARGVRAGYLPQDIYELPPGTLVESVRQVVGGRDELDRRIAAAQTELDEAVDDEARLELAQRLHDLHEESVTFEEHFGRHRAEEILSGLGFGPADFDRDISVFSGGWKMRAALAGLLLLSPELLLLDEPTNHLDVPSLAWFDDFLRRSRKALVLVSHDREFLNRQIGRVISFETEGLRTYVGNYEQYRAQRAEEEENLELRARRQAAQRAETLRFIERFRYKSSKARQVQSRVKRLEKQETIQTRDARKTVRFRFPEVARSGRDVIKIEGLAKAFGEKVIYRDLTRTVNRGDRIAIIGRNGAGKTTLLKLIAGELAADAGRITLGANVQVAYYAQHHTETLDRDKTILDEVWGLVPREAQSTVRGILGAFLFSGDDVDKRVGVLSGGERARVALARLLVLPSNVILMDEPTNHLDLDSSERLVEALKEYGGTLIFVSHNRSFINQLATKTWDVTGGDIVEWPGNLDAYFYHQAQLAQPMATTEEAPKAVGSEKERRQREAREREARNQRLRPIKNEIAQLEKRIGELEAEQKEIEPKLADPAFYGDFAKSGPMLAKYQQNREKLEELYARWEHQQERLSTEGDQAPE